MHQSKTVDPAGERRTGRAGVTRRGVLGFAAGAGAASLLVACGGESDTETGQPDASSPGSESTAGSEETAEATAEATVLAKTADVPVGSAVIIEQEKVVVAQPEPGQFKAYSAICTHQSCVVSGVKDQRINCQCHGSAFSAADGSVLNGPATRPLREIKVKVEGASIIRE